MAEETTLTVLFSDLVGSTQLSSQFDPEDWRDIVRAYQHVSMAILQRLGGHLAQYQGDGLLVYFGYPQAHEEDAQHAVQAGLGIVTAVAELNEQLQQEYGIALAVRIGVHTGPAVFGALGETSHLEQRAVGETPMIAAGIQDLAAPNSVVVSTSTAEHLSDAYATDDRGAHPIKGVAAPVQVFQVRPIHQDRQHNGSAATSDSTEQRLDEAERRQLTVMFCQLAGAAQLTAQLSPEAVLNVVRDYQTMSVEVIARYDGHIAQYLDTGLLVYFGYPRAHEDDAQRAVRAGLAIVEATQPLSNRLTEEQGIEVALRMGIHTGLVVAGEVGGGNRTEQLAMGETPNIAARVQGAATPGTVVLSPTTAQLIAGYFEWEELGSHELKGVPEPMLLRRVVRESGARSRLEAAGQARALVGREAETSLLQERWAQSQMGQGQVVFVSGEAGIGKSRLVEALCEQAEGDGATLLRLRCSPYYQNSAFYSLTELLQDWLGFAREEGPEVKLAKLERTLEAYQFPEPDTAPLFARFFSLPDPADYPPLTGTPQQQRQKTQEALVAWLREEAARRPTLVVWEDLHWVDPSSLEVLSLLLKQVEQTRLCVLPTARPEFVPPWEAQSHLTCIELQRLGAGQIENLIANVTEGRILPAEVQEQIVAKTDGIPLFVEELTKTIMESGILRAVNGHYELTRPLTAGTIPLTLQDALMARLDRLGPAKGVAQVGAVIGREFAADLLQAVHSGQETGLAGSLRQLVNAEIVAEQVPPPQASYQFRHALIQDTAYASLLRRTRQRYHGQIAQVLQEHFVDTVEVHPELVAHHYTEARNPTQAIPYWQKAGERAAQRSAHKEAISHLTKGLELLKTLPDTPERTQQELTLQITLGPALIAIKGYGAPEVEHAYSRALELCRQLGETPQLFHVLRGLIAFYSVRGESQTAKELTEQLLRLAQSTQDPAFLLIAHGTLGAGLVHLGEFASAREHLEQGIVLYDPQQHNPHTLHTAHDLGVVCLSYTTWTLWYLGYPDQALKRGHEALTLAQELSHPVSLDYALHTGALVHQLRRERQAVQERAEAVIALSGEQGLPYFLAIGTILQGWALAEQGQGEEGIVQIHQGLAGLRATGTEHGLTYCLGLLAEAYGKVGQAEKGLSLLAEALAVVNKTGDRWHEVELYRLKGELTLQQNRERATGNGEPGRSTDPRPLTPDPQGEAEACFQRAIAIAQKQQAKSLELRAVMSLSRLWRQQGKKAEAWQLLADVYNWFTEGFDTKDLQEAKALLDSLGSSV